MSELNLEEFIAHLPKTHKVRLEYLLLKTEAGDVEEPNVGVKKEVITIVESCSRCTFQRRSPHGGGQKECVLSNCNRSANYASKIADHCPLKTTQYTWTTKTGGENG